MNISKCPFCDWHLSGEVRRLGTGRGPLREHHLARQDGVGRIGRNCGSLPSVSMMDKSEEAVMRALQCYLATLCSRKVGPAMCATHGLTAEQWPDR